MCRNYNVSLADPGESIISFWHTFLPKSIRIGSWRRPNGNPGSATVYAAPIIDLMLLSSTQDKIRIGLYHMLFVVCIMFFLFIHYFFIYVCNSKNYLKWL